MVAKISRKTKLLKRTTRVQRKGESRMRKPNLPKMRMVQKAVKRAPIRRTRKETTTSSTTGQLRTSPIARKSSKSGSSSTRHREMTNELAVFERKPQCEKKINQS